MWLTAVAALGAEVYAPTVRRGHVQTRFHSHARGVLDGCCVDLGLQAQPVVTNLYPGITHIARTESLPAFQCPGCPSPTPSPRLARLNIVLVDLNTPGIAFKLTPEGTNLPPVNANSTTPGWPLPPPPFEVVRQPTLAFINAAHAQVAINSHFFAPFPVPSGSTQGAYAYLIGLAASRGNVYSAFEAPFQNYAIVTDVPAINIDAANNAGIVHRDPAFADGKHVLENVQLWNAFAGRGRLSPTASRRFRSTRTRRIPTSC